MNDRGWPVLRSRVLAGVAALGSGGGLLVAGIGPAQAGTTYVVTATVQVGSSPFGVAVDPATRTAYVTNSADGTVSVIDGGSGTVTTTVSVGSGADGVAVDPATHLAYVVGDGRVRVLDGSTHAVSATITAAAAPIAVAVDPGTDTVYVTNYVDLQGTVSVIDGHTNALVATIGVGDYPDAVAVDPSTHRVFVANEDDATVSVIDGRTRRVSATVAVGNAPDGIAVDPVTHRVYVANLVDSTISVLDGTTSSLTDSISVGDRPDGVAVDPAAGTVYVSNSADTTVSVIDEATATVTTAAVGAHPYGIAVDPGTHAVYVTEADDNAVSVLRSVVPPGAPAIGRVTAGDASASVSFTAPADSGAGPVSAYTVTALDGTSSARGGQTARGVTTPVTVSGLTNGDSYSFTVTATGAGGTGAPSAASATVVPMAAVGRTSADLAVVLSAPRRAAAGEPFSVQVTVIDHGPDGARSVRTGVSMPPGIRIIDAGQGIRVHSGVLFSRRTLSAGASQTYTVVVVYGMVVVECWSGRPVTFVAGVASRTPDPYHRNDLAHAMVRVH